MRSMLQAAARDGDGDGSELDTATLDQVATGKSVPTAGVLSSVRKWRARRDSNSRPSESKSDALSS